MALWILVGRFVLFQDLLRTVQRADFWEAILAMQVLDAVSLGVDNLHVVRHVGRLLDGVEHFRPVEWDNDEDLIALVRKMIEG